MGLESLARRVTRVLSAHVAGGGGVAKLEAVQLASLKTLEPAPAGEQKQAELLLQ